MLTEDLREALFETEDCASGGNEGSLGDDRGAALDAGLLGGRDCSSLGRGGKGEVRPESDDIVCPPDDILFVLRQSFLMLLTPISEEDDFDAGAAAAALGTSSELSESSEKRLEGAWEVGRDCDGASDSCRCGIWKGGRPDRGVEGESSSSLDPADSRLLPLDGKRPNGSGERGMTGDSVPRFANGGCRGG